VRVFALRISNGQSPFNADKTHIHHLLTNNGWSHGFTTKLICTVHGLILILGFFSQYLQQEAGIVLLLIAMLLVIFLFKRMKLSAAMDKNLQLD
jgi:intracellular septation protein A